MPTGNSIAALVKRTTDQHGADITLPSGAIVRAMIVKPNPTTVEDLIRQGNGNAANPNCQSFHVPSLSADPLNEKDEIGWLGSQYVIVRCDPKMEFNTVITWNYTAIRKGIPDTSSQDAAQKAKFDYVAPA